LAGLLARSVFLKPSLRIYTEVAKEFKKTFHGTYSCGYSSGFSPDSLFAQLMNINLSTKFVAKLNNNFESKTIN